MKQLHNIISNLTNKFHSLHLKEEKQYENLKEKRKQLKAGKINKKVTITQNKRKATVCFTKSSGSQRLILFTIS